MENTIKMEEDKTQKDEHFYDLDGNDVFSDKTLQTEEKKKKYIQIHLDT